MYRPLSPHLQIYRLPLNALLSVSHRLSGMVLSLGAVFLVYLLHAAAAGPQAFHAAQSLLGTWTARGLLMVSSYAFLFHLCTGIRHLVWDTGRGLARDAAQRSGWVVLAASLLLTALIWGIAWWRMTGGR